MLQATAAACSLCSRACRAKGLVVDLHSTAAVLFVAGFAGLHVGIPPLPFLPLLGRVLFFQFLSFDITHYLLFRQLSYV